MRYRKVLFKKWIPADWVGEYPYQRQKEGTNCWEKDFLNVGLFHQWANAYEETSAGFGNYTVALIEIADGTIVSVLPDNVKFIDSPN